MFAEIVSLWVPKSTSAVRECQDVSGYHAATAEVGGAPVVRAAVADGATTGYDAQAWAALLVEGVFADGGLFLPGGDGPWLEALRAAWSERPTPEGAPWYVAEAHRRGSYATLLALAVEAGTGRYVAVGRGDTCLLHRRHGALAAVFPALGPDDFGLTPPLVRTAPAAPPAAEAAPELDRTIGCVGAGDTLLVLSDALAHAALASERDGTGLCRILESVGPAGFAALVTELRSCGAMDDDDVTLLRLSSWSPAAGADPQ